MYFIVGKESTSGYAHARVLVACQSLFAIPSGNSLENRPSRRHFTRKFRCFTVEILLKSLLVLSMACSGVRRGEDALPTM